MENNKKNIKLSIFDRMMKDPKIKKKFKEGYKKLIGFSGTLGKIASLG